MTAFPYHARTLIEPVIERARQRPDHLAVIFIGEDGAVEQVSAAQFHHQSVRFARALEAIGVGQDDLVVLIFRHSQLLLSAFWGALYRGAIPSIFPFLTEKLDPDLYMQRVRLLIDFEQVKAVITYPDFKPHLERLLADVSCRVLSTDEVPVDAPVEDFTPPDISPDRIAFLQHSSGTTGLQKGVALSHRAVLNQLEATCEAIELNEQDVIVCWLPLYHDMGLIAGFIQPLVTGHTTVLISPFHWLRDPKILLWSVHRYRATICWLPNFAFNYMTRTIRERDLEGLDLSAWRVLINAAETVRIDSIEMFAERFGRYGLDRNIIGTAYGMAEDTLMASKSPVGRLPDVDWVSVRAISEERYARPAEPGAPGATPIVGCGYPIKNHEVAIIDEDGHRLAERRVGQIIVRSNCMLTEYYSRPDLTEQAFTADGWYKTGDMGYLAGRQIFMTGRLKDLIIVGGKNVYPQDLEDIANAIPGIYPGRAVAFSVPDEQMGTEAIVLVAELKDHAGPEHKFEIERELRRRVASQTEVTLRDVKLVEERWLIKTSSGKVARNDNREKYLREFGKDPA